MDECDIAAEQELAAMESARNQLAKASRGARLAPVGACHYCDKTFYDSDSENKLFCDSECGSDWEEEQRLRALRSGPNAAHPSVRLRSNNH